ncbi:S24 family peptidase [Formicincola oecophyllae]|uniref:S24 family peptidase n=2 Tax=Formicincola oecophyllae TaxID=2558361 RepID=A0A4Y6UBX5_9PROT|nr:S24 family peptidase [Formicincola oecophyllae]QDH14068.1 S24 family peptidase [Formicincola oecophyllae]
MTYEQAGALLNMHPPAIGRMANGQRTLQPDYARVLWQSFGFPEEDMGRLYTTAPSPDYFKRHGRPFQGQVGAPGLAPRPAPLQAPQQALRTIQVRGAVQAGLFTEAHEWSQQDWFDVTTVAEDGHPQNLPRYGLQVRGESMNRVFPNGSVVAVINFDVLGRAPRTGDYVVVLRRADCMAEFEATVKALQVKEDGTVLLWPKSHEPAFQQPLVLAGHDGGPSGSALNREEMPSQAGAEDIQIVGLVVSAVAGLPPATF